MVGLKELVAWAHGFTCETIVYGEEMEHSHPVQIVSSGPMLPDAAYRVFTAALTEMRLMATSDGDLVRIQFMPNTTPSSSGSVVRKIDDTHYEVPRSITSEKFDDDSQRIVPSVKDGKPDGFKIYAIKPDSLAAKLGLQNGDTIETINGIALTSAERALEIYSKLRDSSSWQLSIRRRGNLLTLNYAIR